MTMMDEAPTGERRAQLERRAAEVRARLEQRLQLLEQRRDGLVHRVRALTTPPVSVAIVAVAGVASALWLAYRAGMRRRDMGRVMVVGQSGKPSALGRMLRRVAISLGVALLRRMTARGVERLAVASSSSDGKVVVARAP